MSKAKRPFADLAAENFFPSAGQAEPLEERSEETEPEKPAEHGFYAKFPREVWKMLRDRAHAEDTDMRVLVLRALRKEGYPVPDTALAKRTGGPARTKKK